MNSSFEFPELAVPRPVEERLAAAEAEREAEVDAARAEGYDEGLAAGRAEVSTAARALASATARLDEMSAGAAADAEPVAVVALADEGSHLPSSHHRHLLEAIAIKLRSAYASGSTFELRTTTKPTNE
jgi:hypothetical protein